MTLRRAKSIDELYAEVRDYRFVLTNDAALATALNAMRDVSTLDGFAFTPKMAASSVESTILKTRPLSDLEIVERIERDTGLDFRYIHSELENIRDIRRYTADVAKYLYSSRAKDVLEIYDSLPTTEKVMSIFDSTVYKYFLNEGPVAVIGLDLFNDLDKHMLPCEFDEIDAFVEGEEYEIGTIYGVGNDRQIAGSIVDLIEPETANDTAIILDPSSPVADAVRSALYRRRIPFKNSLDMKDLAQVRDYIEFLNLALDFRTIRVRDVRELFSVYLRGHDNDRPRILRPEEDNYLLHKYQITEKTDPTTELLIETMKDIRGCKFSQVAEILYRNMPQKASLMMLLDSMDLSEKMITSALVSRLAYAVNNVSDLKHNEQVPEYERHGVLLADCSNSTYVDRSFVIYIGLDSAWEVTAPGKDYVDKEQLDLDNAVRMSILLQQGTSRIYAVKPASDGKDTLPCPTFQTIYKSMGKPKSIKTFADICKEYRLGSWFVPGTVERPESGSMEIDRDPRDWKFSKTSYNAYCDCPIKFMFSELLFGETNENIMLGNCLHELAELYFCYPDLVKEKGLDHYVSLLSDTYAGISDECHREFDLSRFRVYANNLLRYIDVIRPEKVPLDAKVADREHPNGLMMSEGLEFCSTLAEGKIDCDEPMFAKYDVRTGGLICDYKSGKVKEPKDIVDGFLEKGTKMAEYQPLLYLSVLRENTDEPCEFDLFFIGENDIESIDPEYDILRNVRRVVLSKQTARDLVLGRNGTVERKYVNTKSYAKFAERWDSVANVLLTFYDSGDLDSPSLVDALLNAVNVSDNKTNRGYAEQIAKYAREQMSIGYCIADDDLVIVPSDTMDRFVSVLKERHKTATEQMYQPIYDLNKGRIQCSNCTYNRVCLKAFVDDEEGAE